LSISFRRFYKIFLIGNEYMSKSEKFYARMDLIDQYGIKGKRCYVLTKELKKYLKSTNQLLLYGIISHRYSEREIEEFGLNKSGDNHSSDRKNYFFKIQSTTNRELYNRPRARSMSIIFGKYLVNKF